MDVFILSATVLVFVSLMEAVLTAYLAGTERVHLARSIDRKMRVIMPILLVGAAVKAFVL